MEEKERYKLKSYLKTLVEIYDTELGTELLNKQDKRIKELEEENKVGDFWHSAYQCKQLEYDLVYAELRKVYEEIQQLKQQLAKLKQKLTQYKNIENEIGCDIEIFWKVYRRLSRHGKYDTHLYSIFNNEIVEIMPTEIISGTYSNYPQDCSFKYSVWDKICESYQETYSYFHFHDYNNEWFLSKKEAEKKLAEIKGE